MHNATHTVRYRSKNPMTGLDIELVCSVLLIRSLGRPFTDRA
jgi:hypothetical protein